MAWLIASLSSRIAPNTDCSASMFCGGTRLRISSAAPAAIRHLTLKFRDFYHPASASQNSDTNQGRAIAAFRNNQPKEGAVNRESTSGSQFVHNVIHNLWIGNLAHSGLIAMHRKTKLRTAELGLYRRFFLALVV